MKTRNSCFENAAGAVATRSELWPRKSHRRRGRQDAELFSATDLPRDRRAQPLTQINLGLKAEQLTRARNIGNAAHDILVVAERGIGNELDLWRFVAAHHAPDQAREIMDRDLFGRAQIENDVVRLWALDRAHNAVDVI